MPHARIRMIDASKALALPGVEAVVTSADFPDPGDKIAELGEGAVNLRDLSSNCLAATRSSTRATPSRRSPPSSPHIAEEALKLIDVDYEPLPHVIDVRRGHAATARRSCMTN